jgi:hypothetical protein
MKPVLVLSLIVGALFAGFVGATAAVVLGVGTCAATATHEEGVAAPAREARATPVSNGDTEFAAEESKMLHRQVDDLSAQVTMLRSELEGVRADLARQVAPSTDPIQVASVDQIAALQHDQVVKILEEQKQLEQKKRDDERKARDLQQIKDRAARASKELGLSSADETRLVDFMTVAAAKRDEMFASTRDGNIDRDTMRKNFEDYRTWSETELKAQFGNDLAAQLLKLQRDGRGGGWGGDFGGGGGGPPNWGGQNGGGGQGGQGAPGQGGQQGAGQSVKSGNY